MLTYAEMRALSEVVAAHPDWRGPPILIGKLHPAYEADGRSVGRMICYASEAPACTVPHELAHVRSGRYDHGPEWAAEFARLAGLLRVIARNPDQGVPLT